MAFVEQLSPSYNDVSDVKAQDIDQSLGLDAKQQIWSHSPVFVSAGNSFLLAGFNTREEVKALQPDFEFIHTLSMDHDLIGYYVFSRDTAVIDRDASARMFTPRYGINEEAAAGMTTGPLACFLYEKLSLSKERMIIEQGA